MKNKFLNSNELKIIACIFMFIDHLGYFFFPDNEILRIIGRLAMPLFALFIAEGAYYTKNKIAYLANILLLGLIISSVTFAATKEINIDILVSFSLSLILIFIKDEIVDSIYFKIKNKTIIYSIILSIYLSSLLTLMHFFYFEYQLFAILIPLGLSFTNSKYKIINENKKKLIKFLVFMLTYSLCMILSNFIYKINTSLNIQAYGYLNGLFILLYNNKRGKYNLKYLFYIFYPAHVLVMYAILYITK